MSNGRNIVQLMGLMSDSCIEKLLLLSFSYHLIIMVYNFRMFLCRHTNQNHVFIQDTS